MTEAALLAERQRVKALEDALRETIQHLEISRWACCAGVAADARALLAAGETP